MEKQATFGNAVLAEKMASEFGPHKEAIKVEMRYTNEVRKFISKINEAHEKAENSNLKFG